MSTKRNYLKMQKNYYDEYASKWSLSFRDPVVGSYDAHNEWEDYDTYLFKGIDTSDMVAIEYGCGPGRNLVKFNDRFKRIDGIDISEINLEKAAVNLNANNIDDYNLFLTSGSGFDGISAKSYDVVFAVICLQHICSFTIRNEILKDARRVLKTGGHLCFQMGYGGKEGIDTARYNDDVFDAKSTNGHSDVSVMSTDEITEHLTSLGFKDIEFDIRPTGPGDNHRNWIWVRAVK